MVTMLSKMVALICLCSTICTSGYTVTHMVKSSESVGGFGDLGGGDY